MTVVHTYLYIVKYKYVTDKMHLLLYEFLRRLINCCLQLTMRQFRQRAEWMW